MQLRVFALLVASACGGTTTGHEPTPTTASPPRVHERAKQPVDPRAMCPLELVRDDKAASAPAAGAWPPSADGGWLAWSDYRSSDGTNPSPPDAVLRGPERDDKDIQLGTSRGATAVLVDGDRTLAARTASDGKLVLDEVRGSRARTVGSVGGDQALLPMLARAGASVGVAWIEGLDHRRLAMATLAVDGTFSASIVLSPTPVSRARMVAVSDGFVLAWTQLPRDVWFARVRVDAGKPRVMWTTRLEETGAGEWPSIQVEELGELAVVDDQVYLPLLKATSPGLEADTHVLRVGLDGTARSKLELRAAPFFTAAVSKAGIALTTYDHDMHAICVRRFSLVGREQGAVACFPTASRPDFVPIREDGYGVFFLMRATSGWVGDELHIATLDLHGGTVFPTHRVLRCRSSS